MSLGLLVHEALSVMIPDILIITIIIILYNPRFRCTFDTKELFTLKNIYSASFLLFVV